MKSNVIQMIVDQELADEHIEEVKLSIMKMLGATQKVKVCVSDKEIEKLFEFAAKSASTPSFIEIIQEWKEQEQIVDILKNDFSINKKVEILETMGFNIKRLSEI